jgi:hypothetical protein
LAVALLVTISDWMTRPAWALEQTIDALKNIRAVYIAGRMYSPWQNDEEEFEAWARPQSDGSAQSGDYRYREGDYHLCVASVAESVTYVYERYQNPKQDVVYITKGINRGMHTFPSGDLLAEFKAMAEDWREEIRKDPQTGKSPTDLQTVYASYGPIEQVSISRMNHLNDPGTFVEVFCVLRMKDSSTHHSLLNVAVKDTRLGRIGVIWQGLSSRRFHPRRPFSCAA